MVELEQMIQSGTLPIITKEFLCGMSYTRRIERIASRHAKLPGLRISNGFRDLIEQGRLLVAGPMPNIDSPDPGPAGFSGSTVIAEFDSLEVARQWAASDPYVEAGVYEYVEVRPFIKALP